VKVTCLHEGSMLAEGSLDVVSANERVVEVYLGRAVMERQVFDCKHCHRPRLCEVFPLRPQWGR
jgi:hypothetical protein